MDEYPNPKYVFVLFCLSICLFLFFFSFLFRERILERSMGRPIFDGLYYVIPNNRPFSLNGIFTRVVLWAKYESRGLAVSVNITFFLLFCSFLSF